MAAKKLARTHRINVEQLSGAFRARGDLLAPEDVISFALAMCVPGPSWLIAPKGKAVRLVLLALRLSGYKIVPSRNAA